MYQRNATDRKSVYKYKEANHIAVGSTVQRTSKYLDTQAYNWTPPKEINFEVAGIAELSVAIENVRYEIKYTHARMRLCFTAKFAVIH